MSMAWPLLLLLPLTTTSAWQHAGTAGPKISGAATGVTACGKLLLFGGLDENRVASGDCWVFDGGSWAKVATTGGGPGPRMYASGNVQRTGSREEFVVAGGWDPEAAGSGGSFKDDVWALDVATMAWMREDPLPCGPVSRHGSVAVADRSYVHTFREDHVLRRDACGVLKAHRTSGDAPNGMSMCAMAPLGDSGRLVVFGGSSKDQGFSGETRLLDTRTYEWTKLSCAGPSPRGSCAAAALDGSRVLVFGGAGVGPAGYDGGKGLVATDETWVLTVDDAADAAKWTKVDAPHAPPPRVAASLEALPGRLVLCGGWDPATGSTFDDVWTYPL